MTRTRNLPVSSMVVAVAKGDFGMDIYELGDSFHVPSDMQPAAGASLPAQERRDELVGTGSRA